MPNLPERSFDATRPQDRFDRERVRRILQRAVAEQHRRESELADSYSLAELEEIAAEAKISPQALRAAIEADRRDAGRARAADAADDRPQDWITALEHRLPTRWSPAVKQMALAGGGVVALTGLLLSLSVFAPTAFWVTSLSLIVLSLAVMAGASPF